MLPRTRFAPLSACLPIALGLLFGPASSASTTAQYIALRKQHHWNKQLTYAEVYNDATAHVGKVMELRGTVGGKVETGDGLSIMLNMSDGSAAMFHVPEAEARLIRDMDTPRLRVLVKVGESTTGNVAPLQVLALTHDSGVTAVEEEEAARAAAAAKRAEQKRQAEELRRQQALAARQANNRTSLAYRGDSPRDLPATVGEMEMANYYTRYLGVRVQPLFWPYYQFIRRNNTRLDMQMAGKITYHLLRFADGYDVDPRLVVSMIIAESNFDPNSTSRTGAMGLGQLMPGTARSLGVKNPYDPEQNLFGAVGYLRSRLDTFADKAMPGGGLSFEQVRLAMAAYNAGAGAVKKYGGIPPYRETQAYVRRVESLYRQLCQ